LDRAVGILQKEMNKNPASLAQVDTASLDSVLKGLNVVINAASFSSNDQKKLTALVQQSANSDDEELGAPAAAVYKTHSSSIFDVLEDMKEKAEAQLDELRKAESTTKHNFNMLSSGIPWKPIPSQSLFNPFSSLLIPSQSLLIPSQSLLNPFSIPSQSLLNPFSSLLNPFSIPSHPFSIPGNVEAIIGRRDASRQQGHGGGKVSQGCSGGNRGNRNW
jgi:hypothetical protein